MILIHNHRFKTYHDKRQPIIKCFELLFRYFQDNNNLFLISRKLDFQFLSYYLTMHIKGLSLKIVQHIHKAPSKCYN